MLTQQLLRRADPAGRKFRCSVLQIITTMVMSILSACTILYFIPLAAIGAFDEEYKYDYTYNYEYSYGHNCYEYPSLDECKSLQNKGISDNWKVQVH